MSNPVLIAEFVPTEDHNQLFRDYGIVTSVPRTHAFTPRFYCYRSVEPFTSFLSPVIALDCTSEIPSDKEAKQLCDYARWLVLSLDVPKVVQLEILAQRPLGSMWYYRPDTVVFRLLGGGWQMRTVSSYESHWLPEQVEAGSLDDFFLYFGKWRSYSRLMSKVVTPYVRRDTLANGEWKLHQYLELDEIARAEGYNGILGVTAAVKAFDHRLGYDLFWYNMLIDYTRLTRSWTTSQIAQRAMLDNVAGTFLASQEGKVSLSAGEPWADAVCTVCKYGPEPEEFDQALKATGLANNHKLTYLWHQVFAERRRERESWYPPPEDTT